MIDRTLQQLTDEALAAHTPDVVLLSVPFPGSVYAALRIAQQIKARAPQTTVVLGGGYVNTELRELSEPRLFDFVDYVTLDGGERPLLSLLEHLQGNRSRQRLVRTFLREEGDEIAAGPPQRFRPPGGTGEAKPRTRGQQSFATSTSSSPTSLSRTSARPPGTACRLVST